MSLLLMLAHTSIAAEFYALDGTNDALVSFDPVAQTYTTIGSLGFNYQYGDLAFDEDAGVMYAINSFSDNILRVVDLTTGAATAVGDTGITNVYAMAWDANTGLLWAFSGATGGAYTLDTATGVATLQFSPGFYPGGCDFIEPLGQVVCLEAGGTGLLYAIDTQAPAATLLATMGWNNDNGVAYDPDTGETWVVDLSQNLWTFDAGLVRVDRGLSVYGLDAIEAVSGGQPVRFSLGATGTCPGPMSFTARNATAGGRVAFVRGRAGSSVVPGGPCAGRSLPIGSPSLVGIFSADAAGTRTVNGNPGAPQCGVARAVAIDLTTCAVSNVITL